MAAPTGDSEWCPIRAFPAQAFVPTCCQLPRDRAVRSGRTCSRGAQQSHQAVGGWHRGGGVSSPCACPRLAATPQARAVSPGFPPAPPLRPVSCRTRRLSSKARYAFLRPVTPWSPSPQGPLESPCMMAPRAPDATWGQPGGSGCAAASPGLRLSRRYPFAEMLVSSSPRGYVHLESVSLRNWS